MLYEKINGERRQGNTIFLPLWWSCFSSRRKNEQRAFTSFQTHLHFFIQYIEQHHSLNYIRQDCVLKYAAKDRTLGRQQQQFTLLLNSFIQNIEQTAKEKEKWKGKGGNRDTLAEKNHSSLVRNNKNRKCLLPLCTRTSNDSNNVTHSTPTPRLYHAYAFSVPYKKKCSRSI